MSDQPRTLFEKIWESHYDVDTNLLDVYMSKLRAKLEADAGLKTECKCKERGRTIAVLEATARLVDGEVKRLRSLCDRYFAAAVGTADAIDGGSLGPVRSGGEGDEEFQAECVRFAASLPEPPTSVLAASEPRRAVAGWVEFAPGRWRLRASWLTATVDDLPGGAVWRVSYLTTSTEHVLRGDGGYVPPSDAQLAAEDALRAVKREIGAVIGEE